MSNAPATSTDAPSSVSPPRTSSGAVGKITVLAFILAVILGECVAAVMFLGRGEAASAAPAEEENETAAEDKSHSDAGHSEKKASHHSEPKPESAHGHGSAHKAESGHKAGGSQRIVHGDHKEVDLGEYSIMASDPASSTMLMVDFHIFGTISTNDTDQFEALFEENRHRIRNEVIIIVRSAEMEDLTDASLGLLRRKIQEKTNNLLGAPLMREIIFSKFSFIEQ